MGGHQIHNPTVARGMAQWDTMVSDLDQQWKEALKGVHDFLAAAPWGGGSEGSAFQESFLEGNGYQLTLERGSRIVRELTEMGKTLRDNVGNSLTTEDALTNGIGNGFVDV